MPTKLTDNFTIEELTRSSTAIRLGLDNSVPNNLIANMRRVTNVLEIIRAHFDSPIHVTSCYRSPAVNAAVGGSPTSAHRFAHAADFEVKGVPNIKVCQWIAENIEDYDQVIYEFGLSNQPYAGWVHLGFTHGKSRKQKLSANKIGGKTVYTKGFADV